MVRRTTRHRPGEAADPGDRRCRPPTEPTLVDPPRPHRRPTRRAGHPVPERSWPAADTGRSVASGTARTLQTRDAKHEPRSLAAQRATWLSEAAAVLGSAEAVAAMVQTTLARHTESATIADARWIAQTASHVLAVIEVSRSTWQMWHVRAEAQRQVRTIDLPAEHAAALVDLLVDEVLDRRSVPLLAPADNVEEPELLRRVDGSSVYTEAGAALYTSTRILDAEACLSPRPDAEAVRPSTRRRWIYPAGDGGERDCTRCWASVTGPPDVHLRGTFAAGDRPAGAGKTTAMRALTPAWTQEGGQVLGLALSAAAAAVLAEQTGIHTDTLANHLVTPAR